MTQGAGASIRGRYPVKRAIINVATAADHPIVAAVPGHKIVVIGWFIASSGNNTLTWKSGSNAITGPMDVANNTIFNDRTSETGVFETESGEALVLTLSGSNKQAGYLSYVEY